MTKQKTIALICKCNRTVTEQYLTRFNEDTLKQYLRRLTRLNHRRGRHTSWVRQTTSRSVVTRGP